MSSLKSKVTIATSILAILAQPLFATTSEHSQVHNTVPSEYIWNFQVNIKKPEVNTSVYITELEIDSDIVHYDGPNSIKYLTGTLRAHFSNPAPALLKTYPNFAFWRIFNLESLKQSVIWSDEKIDMAKQDSKFKIPFTQRYTSMFDPLSKGPYMIRGHNNFSVYAGNELVGIATRNAYNQQISPEASAFGNARTSKKNPFKDTIFTLGDLSSTFDISIEDFRSSGKKNEWFSFKIILTDSANEKLPLYRASKLNVSSNDKNINTEMFFDEWNIPQGYFVGHYDEDLPETININLEFLAATPTGNKTINIKKTFPTVASGVNPQVKKTATSPEKEWRLVYVYPPSAFSQNPETGKKQINDLVEKVKKNNFNTIIAFLIGNRGWQSATISNTKLYPSHPQYDVFEELSKNCRANSLKLGAAICLLPEGAEKLSGVLKEHPEWAMRDINNSIMGWMDPVVPEVRAYRIKDILEAVKKYDLDDISLDYSRLASYPSDRGSEIYMEKFGKDPRSFKNGSSEYIHWFTWTSQHLTLLIKEIREALQKESPKTTLSAYVQGSKYAGELSWLDNHQPYLDWVKLGYIDLLYPTGYIYDMLEYKSWTKRQIELSRNVNPKVPCLITIGLKNNHGKLESFEELLYQIDTITEIGGDGAAFFHWGNFGLWADRLGETRYSKPAQPLMKK